MKNYILVGIVILLLVISVVNAIQINAVKQELTTGATPSAGETYEQMMARMHPDLAASAGSSGSSGNSGASASAMVGGC